MAKKDKPVEANVNTTDLEIPQTMHIEAEPIKAESSDEEPPIFKDEVRDSIFAKRRKQLEEEITSQGLSSVEPIEEIPAEPMETVQAEAPPATEPEEPEPAAGTLPEKIKIKVEGKEMDVPMDTLISLAQKGMSADQRYQQAADEKKQAQQLMFAMQQNTQQPAAQEKAPQIENPLIKLVPEIAKRFNYGSEEEQRQALLDYGAAIEAKVRDETKTLPPEQLVHAATQNALAILNAEKEQDILKAEFADILADYPLSMATDTIANQLAYKYQQDGVQKTRLELFREAGKTARERYLAPRQNLPVQTANTVQAAKVDVSNDKIERKRAAPKPPVTANKIAMEAAPQYGVNPSSVVNKMRQARGQPVYN